jgi:hypothetical protein
MKEYIFISDAQASPIAGVPASERKTGRKTSVKGSKRAQDPFWAALNSARKHLKNRLYGGVLSPSDVIIRVLKEMGYDEKEFHHEFIRKVTRLLQDAQFCKECTELGMNPVIVAQHVVYAGKRTYQLSREKHIQEIFLNGKLAKMQEPIFALKKRSAPLALLPAKVNEVIELEELTTVVAD